MVISKNKLLSIVIALLMILSVFAQTSCGDTPAETTPVVTTPTVTPA